MKYVIFFIILVGIFTINLVSADQSILTSQTSYNQETVPFYWSTDNTNRIYNLDTGDGENFPIPGDGSWTNISEITIWLRGSSLIGENNPITIDVWATNTSTAGVLFSDHLASTTVFYTSTSIGQVHARYSPPIELSSFNWGGSMTILLKESHTGAANTSIVYYHGSDIYPLGYMGQDVSVTFCSMDDADGLCNSIQGAGYNPYNDLAFQLYGNSFTTPTPTPTPTPTGTSTSTSTSTATASSTSTPIGSGTGTPSDTSVPTIFATGGINPNDPNGTGYDHPDPSNIDVCTGNNISCELLNQTGNPGTVQGFIDLIREWIVIAFWGSAGLVLYKLSRGD